MVSADIQLAPVAEAMLLDLDAGIRERLRCGWREYFPDRDQAAPPTISLVRSRHHGYSIMLEYRVAFDGTSEGIFAKVRRDYRGGSYAPGRPGSRAVSLARREFEELRRTHDHLRSRGSGLRVVRPVAYLEDLNTVIVAKAAGQDLGMLVKKDTQTARRVLSRCGEWLRVFHGEIHEVRPRRWLATVFAAGIARRRRLLVEAGVPAADLDALLGPVLEAAERFDGQTAAWSTVHGDYKLRHIWTDGEALQVLDFGNVHEGPCDEDVAGLLVELSLLRLGSPWTSRGREDRLWSAFLDAYAGDGRLLPFAVIDGLLKKWHRRVSRWSRSTMGARLQSGLRVVGLEGLATRYYLNRWFAGRVRRELASLPASRKSPLVDEARR
jgi:hypothetical protein